MKVAVILRGEPRELEYTYKNIQWALSGLEPVYFISVWDSIYDMKTREDNLIDKSPIVRVANELQATLTFFNKSETNLRRCASSVSDHMFTIWKKSAQVMYDYEEEHDCIFDYVVSLRPDVVFYKQLNKNMIDGTRTKFHLHSDGCVGHTHGFDGGFANDNVYMAHRSLIGKLHDVYEYLDDKQTQVLDSTHNILFDYIHNYRIIGEHDPDLALLNSSDMSIVRPGFLSRYPEIDKELSDEFREKLSHHNCVWWDRAYDK